jgi:hypothetical protein
MAYKNPGRHPARKDGLNVSTGSGQAMLDYLDRLEASIANLQWFIEKMLGGSTSNGVVAFNGLNGINAGKVTATSPYASMKLDIKAGAFFVDKVPFKILSNATTPDFVAPTGEERIDVVAASAFDASFVIITGIEDPSPVAPALEEGMVALAHVRMRPGMTEIGNTDTSGEGYVINVRNFINA